MDPLWRVNHHRRHFTGYSLFTLAEICRRQNVCRRPVNQNTPSERVLRGWAWLGSATLAVIGRPSKNVRLQFGVM